MIIPLSDCLKVIAEVTKEGKPFSGGYDIMERLVKKLKKDQKNPNSLRKSLMFPLEEYPPRDRKNVQ